MNMLIVIWLCALWRGEEKRREVNDKRKEFFIFLFIKKTQLEYLHMYVHNFI